MTSSLIAWIGTVVYGWDLHLFQAIHPTVTPSPVMLHLARVFADGPLVLTAGVLGLMLVWPRGSMRATALKALVAAAVALIGNALIGVEWDRARPFVAGVGHAWITHAATGSFPSDHLTAQWVVAGVLWLDPRTRRWGMLVALLGLPMAWARIYLGVHYPGDMMGALAIAAFATLSIWIAATTRSRSRVNVQTA
ncbi:phosphatase PAP2 family protein [Rhodanobacter thiooxydans]|jgi:undecaprenyl-diphosphatase|uniref:phosphatase PAP2 family protein n=1 Tax=Rhodanobacter thiooxydans TaxID=416169 RepID=UPI000260C4C6|nr:phosphatase PAP2 family protein [Rhodanobacter thiooxydans]EIM01190.1 phosphoesterase, PA-phosphatase-like protein [Rhodanobacter thiooxydans LCS2]